MAPLIFMYTHVYIYLFINSLLMICRILAISRGRGVKPCPRETAMFMGCDLHMYVLYTMLTLCFRWNNH